MSNTAATSEPSQSEKGFWRKRVVRPLRTQFTQGATPEELSHAVACGLLCGVFPILGTTSVVATVVGMALKLNQTVIQSLHWLVYPLHLVLIPVYIRAGEFLFGAPPIPFSIPDALDLFVHSPGEFFSKFGMTCVHCIVAWAVTMPFIAFLIIVSVRPLIRRASVQWKSQPPESS
ncbi:MAG: DUF2062 domain-containing protein [Verrucomicrobiae bacterium]|nr:DUF2062 domain-containing protein [Verrucomicrobiae bacterium]